MSDSIDRVFVHALNTVKKIPRTGTARPPPADRLKLYGLYKQSMEGDVDGVMERPRGDGDEVRSEQEKWDAWNMQKGLSRTEAKRQYISTLIGTMHRYASSTPDSRELVLELEFVWDQIKSNPPSYSSSGHSIPLYADNHPSSPTKGLQVLSPISAPDPPPDDDEFVDAPDSRYDDQEAEQDSPSPSPGAHSPPRGLLAAITSKTLGRRTTTNRGSAAGGGGGAAATPSDAAAAGGAAQTESGRARSSIAKGPARNSPPTPPEIARWHRRIESAMMKITAEMAALREQIEMQGGGHASTSSLLPFTRANRRSSSIIGGIGDNGGGGVGGVFGRIAGILQRVVEFVVGVCGALVQHLVLDACLLAIVLFWMRYRGIPAERLEKVVLDAVRAVKHITLLDYFKWVPRPNAGLLPRPLKRSVAGMPRSRPNR